MTTTLGYTRLDDIDTIRLDYLERIGQSPQPESEAEIVEVDGEVFVRLRNCHGVLAVYGADDQYVERALMPEL